MKNIKVRSKDELTKFAELKKKDDFATAIPTCGKIEVEEKVGKETVKSEFPVQVKPVLLLLAHMHGLLKEYDLDNEVIRKEMEIILRNIPAYLDIAIMITMFLNQEAK